MLSPDKPPSPTAIFLDSGAQENIIINPELLDEGTHEPCQRSIILPGIVDGAREVSSMGCGTIFGMQAYYCPDATANLISYGQLLRRGYEMTTEDYGKRMCARMHSHLYLEAEMHDDFMLSHMQTRLY